MFKRVGDITLYAVDDRGLIGILEKLGIYQDAVDGRLRCYLCGRAVSMRNLGGIFKHGGQIRVSCSDIRCLYEATMLTARRRGSTYNSSRSASDRTDAGEGGRQRR